MLKRKQKGFTLIELLVVISILTVMALVAIPNVMSMIGIGDLAVANIEADTVRVAVLAWSIENDHDMPSGDISPEDLGGLAPYIDRDIVGLYSIIDGAITGTGGWDRLEWEDDKWIKSES